MKEKNKIIKNEKEKRKEKKKKKKRCFCMKQIKKRERERRESNFRNFQPKSFFFLCVFSNDVFSNEKKKVNQNKNQNLGCLKKKKAST